MLGQYCVVIFVQCISCLSMLCFCLDIMSGTTIKRNIILLTGDPGCGKTTLVQKVYQALLTSQVKVEGFYTSEVRAGGQRSGFDVVLLNDGGRGPLARVAYMEDKKREAKKREAKEKEADDVMLAIMEHEMAFRDDIYFQARSTVPGPKVGKYTVDLKSFESLVQPILTPEKLKVCQVLILDEIGKMELFSKQFESSIQRIFQTSQVILATVPTRGSYLVEQLKTQAGSNLIQVHHGNRDILVEEIKNKLLLQIK
uniref:Cancer-related nucleoside-triphosphatase n=1 Tax=Cacopsylla melanoneura TaxID=428564 RepID=A0A8D8S6B2_9HEMI